MVISLQLTACSGPFSALDPAGPAARDVAGLWWAMFGFSTLVLIAVTALWIYAIRRPASHADEQSARALQNRWIIWGGLALPLGSIALLLAFGIPIGHRMLPLPSADGDVLQIEVTGHQWRWEVHYPEQDIDLANEVHIPVNTPVDVVLRSNDVIHSFWVPRLGGKMDMIPGRTNVLRLQADEPGEYRGSCAEFCGVGHAHMQFTVTAHTEEDFARWQQQAQESAE
ncbi:cytochrome c oxidase subunit II [Salinispirillum sp. LH 10-3-1]|uniref:cytochrome-c oxidase n=1 Tax=Salinispirillum sp. LH 10-3-1 TaxID=2952525 RepID=A0AB38YGY2_9GAMM